MTEVVSCPSCSKKLQVPEDFFGKTVQCPECKQTFRAEPTSAAGSIPVGNVPAGSVSATPSQLPGPPSVPEWEKPPRKTRDEDEDERPRRRRHRDEDEDDEESDRPRRRRLMPHRGGMILAFGIMSLFIMPIVFGPLAWFMGSADLREMRAGRMDPSGESQTNTGRIIGMVGTLLWVIGIVIGCLLFMLFMMLGIIGGAAHHHHR